MGVGGIARETHTSGVGSRAIASDGSGTRMYRYVPGCIMSIYLKITVYRATGAIQTLLSHSYHYSCSWHSRPRIALCFDVHVTTRLQQYVLCLHSRNFRYVSMEYPHSSTVKTAMINFWLDFPLRSGHRKHLAKRGKKKEKCPDHGSGDTYWVWYIYTRRPGNWRGGTAQKRR